MAFPLPSEGPAEDEVTGEVLLCPGLAARQAREHGVTYQNELDRLLVHGLLHLAGRTDATADERTAMLAEGENLLAAFPAQS